jgi:hypothetical protein
LHEFFDEIQVQGVLIDRHPLLQDIVVDHLLDREKLIDIEHRICIGIGIDKLVIQLFLDIDEELHPLEKCLGCFAAFFEDRFEQAILVVGIQDIFFYALTCEIAVSGPVLQMSEDIV